MKLLIITIVLFAFTKAGVTNCGSFCCYTSDSTPSCCTSHCCPIPPDQFALCCDGYCCPKPGLTCCPSTFRCCANPNDYSCCSFSEGNATASPSVQGIPAIVHSNLTENKRYPSCGKEQMCCDPTAETCAYFVSTYNYGCCPNEKICGSVCCDTGKCMDGKCCPSDRVCGEPPNEVCCEVSCRDGRCCGHRCTGVEHLCCGGIACCNVDGDCCNNYCPCDTGKICGNFLNTDSVCCDPINKCKDLCCDDYTQCYLLAGTNEPSCCARERYCGSECCKRGEICAFGQACVNSQKLCAACRLLGATSELKYDGACDIFAAGIASQFKHPYVGTVVFLAAYFECFQKVDEITCDRICSDDFVKTPLLKVKNEIPPILQDEFDADILYYMIVDSKEAFLPGRIAYSAKRKISRTEIHNSMVYLQDWGENIVYAYNVTSRECDTHTLSEVSTSYWGWTTQAYSNGSSIQFNGTECTLWNMASMHVCISNVTGFPVMWWYDSLFVLGNNSSMKMLVSSYTQREDWEYDLPKECKKHKHIPPIWPWVILGVTVLTAATTIFFLKRKKRGYTEIK